MRDRDCTPVHCRIFPVTLAMGDDNPALQKEADRITTLIAEGNVERARDLAFFLPGGLTLEPKDGRPLSYCRANVY